MGSACAGRMGRTGYMAPPSVPSFSLAKLGGPWQCSRMVTSCGRGSGPTSTQSSSPSTRGMQKLCQLALKRQDFSRKCNPFIGNLPYMRMLVMLAYEPSAIRIRLETGFCISRRRTSKRAPDPSRREIARDQLGFPGPNIPSCPRANHPQNRVFCSAISSNPHDNPEERRARFGAWSFSLVCTARIWSSRTVSDDTAGHVFAAGSGVSAPRDAPGARTAPRNGRSRRFLWRRRSKVPR